MHPISRLGVCIELVLCLVASAQGQTANTLKHRLGASTDELTVALREQLSTLAGRIAFEQRLSERAEELRTRAQDNAAARFAKALGNGPAEELFRAQFLAELVTYRDATEQARVVLDTVAMNLVAEPGLHERFRVFLESAAAVHLLVLEQSQEPTRDRSFRIELEQFLHELKLETQASRAAARSLLTRIETARSVTEKIHQALRRVAVDIQETDALHTGIRAALSDRWFAALTLGRRAEGSLWNGDSAELEAWVDEIAGTYRGAFESTDAGLQVRRILFQDMQALLDRFEAHRPRLEALQAIATRALDKTLGMSALRVELQGFLASETYLAWSFPVPHPQRLRTALQQHLDWLTFAQSDGSRRINRHAVGRLTSELTRHEQTLESHRPWFEALSRAGTRLGEAQLREAFDSTAAGYLLRSRREAELSNMPEAEGTWVDDHLAPEGDHLVARPGLAEELRVIGERSAEVSLELDSSPAPLVLDPAQFELDTEMLELLRSSAFFNPRTAGGAALYLDEFADHFAARLFGTFTYTVGNSKSLEDGLARLRNRKSSIEEIATVHDKLIILVAGMPRWLSVSEDTQTFSGDAGWQNFKAHSAKDWDQWRLLVRETVRLFADVENCELYIEVWNEPDGQFWQEGVDEFLRLYEETARAVKAENPSVKVGGTAVNQWDRPLRSDPDRDPLNLELIRFARTNDVPLDFISWHHFGRPVTALEDAKRAYTAEFEAQGYEQHPELVISEWSIPNRGNVREGVSMAQMMLALFRAKVDIQTVASWEEFHIHPDHEFFAPWGMITQQGFTKPQYHVHRFFDRLSRDSRGVAVIESTGQDRFEGNRTLAVSSETDGTLEILAWGDGHPAPMAAGLRHLTGQGMTTDDLRLYRDLETLEIAIREGKALREQWQSAFTTASELYERTGGLAGDWMVLEFPEGSRVELLEAESVEMEPETATVVVCDSEVAIRLRQYREVVRLRLRLE